MENFAEIKSALDASNTALEAFRKMADERFAKLEKGQGGVGDLQAAMETAFAEFKAQKAIVENLEAKMRRPNFGSGNAENVDPAQVEHREAFARYLRKGVEFDKQIEVKALNVGTGADGAFAVPKVVAAGIDAIMPLISPIRSIARVITVSTPDYHQLVDVGGTSSGWVGETQARTETNTPQLVDVAPPMGEIYAMPKASQASLDDIYFDAEGWLARSVATEFALKEGTAFVSGSGTNQPRGFANYTTAATGDATRAFGTVEHVGTGASGAWKTVSASVSQADDFYTMVSKLKKQYRANARWVCNTDLLFEIMQFKANSGQYIFNPTTAPGMTDTILGYPIVEAPDMAAKAANSLSLAFGDFQAAYLIVDRVGVRTIRDPFTAKPHVLFYTTKRVGGGLVNTEAIKLLKFA